MALAIGVQVKWLDNLLSHHALPGVVRSSQGVPRRLAQDGMVAIEICRILVMDFGIPSSRAAAIATELLERKASRPLVLRLSPEITLAVDLPQLEQRLQRAVLDAIDVVPRPRRGRPPLRHGS